MKLKIFNYTSSDKAVSYDDGKKCLDDILKYIDEEDVTLDFEGVQFAITAFLNPVIGDLIIQKGAGIMDKIQIENANSNIVNKIVIVRDGALLKREEDENK